MPAGQYRFDQYRLDVADRRLMRGSESVDVSGRYFDALALLVSESGRLVSKDRFMDEVWRGVPVTDEALTQCIRSLRRELGDDVSVPRFIETVPKHGYRFIAPVDGAAAAPPAAARDWRGALALGLAGTLGGGIAGVIGGLLYGFAAAAQPGTGAISVVLVSVAITAVVALIGAAGVAFGIALAGLDRRAQWTIAGGALGGLVVGGIVKLLAHDAFTLLVGHAPASIAGPFEGVLVGAVTGIAVAVAVRVSLRVGIAVAIAAGGATGARCWAGICWAAVSRRSPTPFPTRACVSTRSASCSASAASGRSARRSPRALKRPCSRPGWSGRSSSPTAPGAAGARACEVWTSLVYYIYNTHVRSRSMLESPLAKRTAIAAAIGAAVAIPLPFIGPILGAIVGGGIGYFTAPQR